MLNTGKVTGNGSYLHSATPQNWSYPYQMVQAAKHSEKVAVLGTIEGFKKAGPQLSPIASAGKAQFKPHQTLYHPEFNRSKAGISDL